MKKTKTIKLDFACDKDWDDMPKVADGERHCSVCNTCVHDFTHSTKNIEGSFCGHFNVSQLSSIKRTLTLNQAKAASISLLTFLGISAASQETKAQDVSPEIKEIEVEDSELKVKGRVYNKKTNQLFQGVGGMIEVYNDSALVGVAMIRQSGRFELKIDTLKNDLKDLKVAFENVWVVDKTIEPTVELIFSEDLKIELQVSTGWANSVLYDVSGGACIKPKEEVTIKGIPPKEKKRTRKKKNK